MENTWAALVFSAALLAPGVAAAAPRSAPARIATADTAVLVAAEPGGPRLLSLGGPSGAAFQARGGHRLIDHVEIDGVARPVRWALQTVTRAPDGRGITYVYASRSPKLRLRWEWRARLEHGPIEHTIS